VYPGSHDVQRDVGCVLVMSVHVSQLVNANWLHSARNNSDNVATWQL